MTPKERAAMQQALEAFESAPVQYDFNSYPMLVMTPDTLQTTLTALREALAEQAEQEPVAKFLEDNLVVENERVDKSGHRVLEIREEELLRIMEIYAAPFRTKDLTDDEIYPLYPEGPMCDKDMIDFARAVIAADREKNK